MLYSVYLLVCVITLLSKTIALTKKLFCLAFMVVLLSAIGLPKIL